jgi:hypothetical protein
MSNFKDYFYPLITKSYKIDPKEIKNFMTFLTILKNESKLPLLIMNTENELLIKTSPSNHERINLSWKFL